jgi:hypothetical protein
MQQQCDGIYGNDTLLTYAATRPVLRKRASGGRANGVHTEAQ